MRKSDLTFSFLLIPFDFFALLLAGLTAYLLRFKTLVDLRPVIYQIPLEKYLGELALISLFWLIIFALSNLYAIQPRKKWIDETIKIFLACSTGIMLVIIIVFLKRELFTSRFIVLSAWVLSFIFVTLERSIVRFIRHFLFKRGIGIHQIILIGDGKITEEIAKVFYRDDKLGYKIIERIKNVEEINKENLEKIKEKYPQGIDEIIQADSNIPKEKNLELLDFCREHNIIFKYAADLFEAQVTNISVETVSGIPIIEVKRTPLDGWGKITKRIIDIIGSIFGLIILSPLFLFIILIVKIDSEGPIFVSLKRVGGKGKTFNLYKFRSMIKNAASLIPELRKYSERQGPLFKIKNDPRITRFGKFIRKTSLDELPQLWNVLKGEMSLVGPRPHEPEEVALYQKNHKGLLAIKPGMTGMAQISGRSDLDFEDEARLDLYYIENWSPKLDLQILLKTPSIVFSRKGAY